MKQRETKGLKMLALDATIGDTTEWQYNRSVLILYPPKYLAHDFMKFRDTEAPSKKYVVKLMT